MDLTDKEKAKLWDEGNNIPNVQITNNFKGRSDVNISHDDYNELIINREMKRKMKKWYESIQIPTDDSIAPLFNDVKSKLKVILGED